MRRCVRACVRVCVCVRASVRVRVCSSARTRVCVCARVRPRECRYLFDTYRISIGNLNTIAKSSPPKNQASALIPITISQINKNYGHVCLCQCNTRSRNAHHTEPNRNQQRYQSSPIQLVDAPFFPLFSALILEHATSLVGQPGKQAACVVKGEVRNG